MDIATCIEDEETYTATRFALFGPAELTQKRRLLICPECKNPAFFRKGSRDGRGPCFGARPHVSGCTLAAEDSELVHGIGDGQDELINLGDRIVIDLNFGPVVAPVHLDANARAPRRPRGGAHFGHEGPGRAVMHRRLSTLLRLLIEAENFRVADQVIQVSNQPPMRARDFFVDLSTVTSQYEHQFRGYWGQLTDAGEGSKGILWLNSGGRSQMSFRLKAEDRGAIMERYRLQDTEDLAGAYILVLGVLRVSANNKMICFIDDLGMMALRWA